MKKDTTLTQQQALDKIVADRQAGQGWGEIAHGLGLKLGHVISDVKKADKAADHVARGKPDKVDHVAKVDKPDKPEKMDKPDKPEKMDKPDKPEKMDKPDKPEKPAKPEKPGR
jgi:hypothetical protein